MGVLCVPLCAVSYVTVGSVNTLVGDQILQLPRYQIFPIGLWGLIYNGLCLYNIKVGGCHVFSGEALVH